VLPLTLDLDHRYSLKVDHDLTTVLLLYYRDPVASLMLHLLRPLDLYLDVIRDEERERLERMTQEKPG
jgi:hypothetical protein